MASSKLQSAMEHQGDDAKMDMSPMIDMVFLLLIFFMVASRMVTVKTMIKLSAQFLTSQSDPIMSNGELFLILDLMELLQREMVRLL